MALEYPKISIISINYNNAKGLRNTILSIRNQKYDHIEYIVVDGGSVDGSKAIIEANADKIGYWVSEADEGIFNAMNKAIKVSKGTYLLFINSGDTLVDDHVIDDVVNLGLSEDLIYGDLVIVNAGNEEYWLPDSELTFNTFFKRSIPHQSTFIRKTLFDKVGLYNEKYKMVSDWEFFLIAVCKYHCTYKHIERYIAVFDKEGISSDPANYPAMEKERLNVFEEHFPLFIKDYKHFASLEREMQKILYFNKARYFIKRLLKAVKLGPS